MDATLSPWWGYGLFLAGVLAQIAIRLPFSRRSKAVRERERRSSGLETLLLGVLMVGVMGLPAAGAAGLLRFADQPFPLWRAALGAADFGAGLVLFYRSHADLGTNWSFQVVVKSEHRLVTSGVYAWVRHPMYSSFLVLGLGQLALIPNWLAGPSGILSCLLFLPFRIRREERAMVDTFGAAYQDYARRTGRLLPTLRRAA